MLALGPRSHTDARVTPLLRSPSLGKGREGCRKHSCQPGKEEGFAAVRWVSAQGGLAEGAGWVGMAVADLGGGTGR